MSTSHIRTPGGAAEQQPGPQAAQEHGTADVPSASGGVQHEVGAGSRLPATHPVEDDHNSSDRSQTNHNVHNEEQTQSEADPSFRRAERGESSSHASQDRTNDTPSTSTSAATSQQTEVPQDADADDVIPQALSPATNIPAPAPQQAAAPAPQQAVAPIPQQAVAPIPQQAVAPIPQQAVAPIPQQAVAPVPQQAVAPIPQQAMAPVPQQAAAQQDAPAVRVAPLDTDVHAGIPFRAQPQPEPEDLSPLDINMPVFYPVMRESPVTPLLGLTFPMHRQQ